MVDKCDNFSMCKNECVLIISGYYHGTRLCNLCLDKRSVKCNKCRSVIGYISYGSTLERYNFGELYCPSCIASLIENNELKNKEIVRKSIPLDTMKLIQDITAEYNISVNSLDDLRREALNGLSDKIKNHKKYEQIPLDLRLELQFAQDLQ